MTGKAILWTDMRLRIAAFSMEFSCEIRVGETGSTVVDSSFSSIGIGCIVCIIMVMVCILTWITGSRSAVLRRIIWLRYGIFNSATDWYLAAGVIWVHLSAIMLSRCRIGAMLGTGVMLPSISRSTMPRNICLFLEMKSQSHTARELHIRECRSAWYQTRVVRKTVLQHWNLKA